MGNFNGTYVRLHAPLASALRNGRSTYGSTIHELSDEDVKTVPAELREELRIWIEAAKWESGGPPPEALEVDTPDGTIENIIAALKRAATARRERAIKNWMGTQEKDWFDLSGRPVPAVARLADDPRIADQLKEYEEDRAARKKAGATTEEGLRTYALSIPTLARAAREKYDVRVASLDHYVGTIARFDEDAMVYRVGTPEYDNSRSEERRAPTEHAFSVLDGVTKYIEQLTQPAGVKTTVGRIQRFRRAVVRDHRGTKKWGLDQPITAVVVIVTAYVAADRVIVFIADEDDRQRINQAKIDEQIASNEIPF